MTVYFTSCVPAALRLNGAYVGVIDGFARRVEVAAGDRVFVEAVPSDDRLPANFMLRGAPPISAPDSADIFLMGGDMLVAINRYMHKDTSLSALCQARFSGNLVTLYRQGGVKLCCERADGGAELTDLDEGFVSAAMSEGEVGGYPVLCIYAKGRLAIVSTEGRLAFRNAVNSYSLGDMLGVTIKFLTCAGAVGECSYSYDGKTFCLVSSRTVETRPVPESVRHFAFFESVLTRADPSKYLSKELKGRAGELGGYLGNFVDVIVPPQKFYEVTGEKRAAGLVYGRESGVYGVRFFATDMAGGLVENIREVEY